MAARNDFANRWRRSFKLWRNRAALDSLDKETPIRLVLAQARTLVPLPRQTAFLTPPVGEREAKLGRPAKTPDHSRPPPEPGAKSLGRGDENARAQGAGRGAPAAASEPGAQARREGVLLHRGADVSGLPQTAGEIPAIKPDLTGVTLDGGVCPCCAKKFKATPPSGRKSGSPPERGEGRRKPWRPRHL